MKVDEFNTQVNDKRVSFYHNQKTHKMEILIDGDPYIVTLARGKAIIEFLKRIEQT